VRDQLFNHHRKYRSGPCRRAPDCPPPPSRRVAVVMLNTSIRRTSSSFRCCVRTRDSPPPADSAASRMLAVGTNRWIHPTASDSWPGPAPAQGPAQRASLVSRWCASSVCHDAQFPASPPTTTEAVGLWADVQAVGHADALRVRPTRCSAVVIGQVATASLQCPPDSTPGRWRFVINAHMKKISLSCPNLQARRLCRHPPRALPSAYSLS
jgi:hypothetical protein